MKRVVAMACLALSLAGCATTQRLRLASAGESMCRHCNCLMPAGTDPEGICPVCNCHHVARQCERGR